MADIRMIPTAALTATTIALVAFVIQYPHVAMWAAVVALVLAVMGLGTLAKETIDLRADLDDKDRHVEALEAEAQLLHTLLTEADLRIASLTEMNAAVVQMPGRPGLSVVPAQRDGGHDHLKADDDWFARLYDDKGDLR